jgi:hypothetical protein
MTTQTIEETEVRSNWQPEWTVYSKRGSPIGITKDDHCFVVLIPTEGDQWHSVKHIPIEAARLIGQLVSD